MRVILLGGGAFRGGYQAAILSRIVAAQMPDAILGISAGALNGALAAQGDLGLLAEVWRVADAWAWNGVPDFLARTGTGGVFSLAPLLRRVQAHVSAARMKCSFGAGVTLRDPTEYRTFFAALGADAELLRVLHGSSAIPGLIAPAHHAGRAMFDGGLMHAFPPAPADWIVTEADVLLTSPLAEPEGAEDGILDTLTWALDVRAHAALHRGLADLRARVPVVRVWAPESPLGGAFRADAKIMRERWARGLAAEPT